MARLLLTYVLLITCFILGGCVDDRWQRGEFDAYVPIYDNDPALKSVSYLPPRKTQHGGKLYTYGTYLLQEETDSGLHIISYQDPAHPVKTGFLRIPGFHKAAIENGYLYADNFDDLVVIPLNDLPALTRVGRVPRTWTSRDFPPYRHVYFECVDPSKGVVVGWRKTKVNNPKCRVMSSYYFDYGEERPRFSAGIVVRNNYLYLADNSTLVSYAITQPLAPVLKQRLETSWIIDSIYALNGQLAVSDVKYHGTNLYNINDAGDIIIHTDLDLSSCQLLLAKGQYLYTVPNPARNSCYPAPLHGMTVYEMDANSAATERFNLPFDTTYTMALTGNHLYAGTLKGISILDVSAPPAVTRFADKAADAYTDIMITGKYLYCRSKTAIDCYDISVPAAIQFISKLAY
ncbi:LVIVD repeat-containing protein [Chitinophaga rhizophila]|uniref:LVIVD repeat-containing protein n=1 Tax=Chitinophaga rhizophila TaxID=2866212 RepID=A0ABS7GBH1_9BACT|nr:hypothetical protein [Chitinophaga rhizophila]MBW8685023.1 hypothetical protein [Chitinophaga rhizophila]